MVRSGGRVEAVGVMSTSLALLRKPAADAVSRLPVTYRIDRTDVIRVIGGSWLDFAESNGAQGLDVVGRSLWDFVSGAEVVETYRALLRQVRGGKPASFTFRCDSPDRRRWYRMRIDEVGETVEFRSVLLADEPRDWMPLIDAGLGRSDELLRLCSWCARFQVGDWVEPEVAVRRLRLLERASLPQITHGMCPSCYTGTR
jgi:hypothetical protein